MHRYPIFQRHHAQIALNFRYITPMPNTPVSLYFAAERQPRRVGKQLYRLPTISSFPRSALIVIHISRRELRGLPRR
jgi:hypothetical protein